MVVAGLFLGIGAGLLFLPPRNDGPEADLILVGMCPGVRLAGPHLSAEFVVSDEIQAGCAGISDAPPTEDRCEYIGMAVNNLETMIAVFEATELERAVVVDLALVAGYHLHPVLVTIQSRECVPKPGPVAI